MPIIVITVLVQILCIYHVVNTGRDKYWIGLILMAPGIGSLIYVMTQVLPSAGKSRTATTLKEGAIKAIDPNRDLREASQAFDLLESVENRIRLADALYGLEKYEEAGPLAEIFEKLYREVVKEIGGKFLSSREFLSANGGIKRHHISGVTLRSGEQDWMHGSVKYYAQLAEHLEQLYPVDVALAS